MCARTLQRVVLILLLAAGAARAGDPDLPCGGCVLCIRDLPSDTNPRWTWIYWYDADEQRLKLTVHANWVPTWYTYGLDDPNCAGWPSWCGGTPPEPNDPFDFEADCDEDGLPDWCQVLTAGEVGDPAYADCDGDLRPDACQIEAAPDLDACNGNGVLDACEPWTDCDGDGQRDLCQIADCAGDPHCRDCDENGWPDGCELDESADCDGDLLLDRCAIADDPNLDCNLNGTLDACEDGACLPPALQRVDPPDPMYDCDVLVWATHCEPVTFALVGGDGCELIEQGTAGGGWHYARLRGCAAGTEISLAAVAGSCATTFVLDASWSDCDQNGRGDACEIETGALHDCDGNAVPDACEALECGFRGEIRAVGPDLLGRFELEVEHCGPVTWEVLDGPAGGCPDPLPLPADGVRQRARLGACAAAEWITVRATSLADPSCQREATIPLGCHDCSGCALDTGDVSLGSIRATFPLGRMPDGTSLGTLLLAGEQPDAALATAAALRLPRRHPAVQVERDAAGAISSVRGPGVLVRIRPLTPDGYAIESFRADQLAADEPIAGSVPARSWQIGTLPGADFALRIAFAHDGVLQRYDIVSAAWGDADWTLRRYDASGGLLERTTSAWSGHTRTVRVVRNGGLAEVTRTEFDATRSHVLREVADPNGAARTTAWRYHADGRLASIVQPDGGWRAYEYDAYGRLTRERQGWRNGGPDDDPNVAPARTWDYTYEVPYDPNATNPSADEPVRIEESLDGRPLRRWLFTHALFAIDPNAAPVPAITVALCDPNAPGPCQRTTVLLDPDDANLVRGVEYADGRFAQVDRFAGRIEFDADATPRLVIGPGLAERVVQVTQRPARLAAPLAGLTTQTRTTEPAALPGWRLREARVYLPEAGTADGFVRVAWRLTALDADGRVVTVRASDGSTRALAWDTCCGGVTETDAFGGETTVTLDGLGRPYASRRASRDGLPGLVERVERLVTGGEVRRTTIREALDTGETRTTVASFDRVGRPRETCDALGRCRVWRYERAPGGGDRVRITRPDGGEEVRTYYRDGRLRALTGPGIADRAWTHRVDRAGHEREVEWHGAVGGPRWIERTRDTFGRVIRVRQPTFGSDVDPNTPDAGDRVRVQRRSYDSIATDARDDGRLAGVRTLLDGAPLHADMRYAYHASAETIVRSGLDLNGDGLLVSGSGETARHLTQRWTWEDGRAWLVRRDVLERRDGPDVVLDVVRLAPPVGDAPAIIEQTNRDGGRRTTSVARDAAGGDLQVRTRFGWRGADAGEVVQRYVAGDPVEFVAADGGRTTLRRNAFGETIARRGPSGVFRATYGADGRVTSASDPAGRTTSYEWWPESGRLERVTDPEGRTRHYEWNDDGRLARVWGAGVYPLALGYDEHGRLDRLTTFRGSAGWFGGSWPGVPGDTRRWVRDPATGLVARVFDPLGNETVLAWDALDRQIAKNLPGAAGGTGIAYDAATGRITQVSYDDGTSPVAFEWTDFGQLAAVTDGAGTRTFAYDRRLELQRIEFGPDSLFPGREIAFEMHSSRGARVGQAGEASTAGAWFPAIERRVRVRDVAADADEYEVRSAFDVSNGRPRVTRLGARPSVRFEWARTGRLTRLSLGRFDRVAHFDRQRGVLESLDLNEGGATRGQITYAHDAFDRPEGEVARGAAAFEPGGEARRWTYNRRDELIGIERYRPGEDPAGAAALPAGRGRFSYDPAGNRTREALDGEPNRPCVSDAGNRLIARGDEALEHDAAGRHTADARWRYTWDAAGRLVALDAAEVASGVSRWRFAYDGRGRRVERRREVYDGNAWQTEERTRWLWLGWRPLLEYDVAPDGTLTPAARLLWGPGPAADASGGLLAIERGNDLAWVFADGRGQARALLDERGGAARVLGTTAFGRVFDEADFAWRGVGQQADATGLVYAGQRYLDVASGRWLSPDPLDVTGGANLYRHVDNQPTRRVDPLGLCGIDLRSLARESPAFAARLDAPPLIRLDNPTLRLPRVSYAGLAHVGGQVVRGLAEQAPRIGGAAGVVGGGSEFVLGWLTVQCSGGLAAPLGVVLIGHGIDSVQAGARSAWSNQPTDTLTFQIGEGIGRRIGGDVGGMLLGSGLDMGVGLGAPLAAGRLLRLGTVATPGSLAGDCCCCELQFVRADSPLTAQSGVLTRGGLTHPEWNVVLGETNEVRIRLGNRVLEVDFEPIVQHDGTLHLMDIDVLDSIGGPNVLGQGPLLNLLEQLRAEATALGFRQLRITGYRTTGARPGRPVDRCWPLSGP